MNDNHNPRFESSAGQGQTRVNDRILALSDGVFAIAITLLVLTINVPSNLTSSEEVSRFLLEVLPEVVVYAAAFMVIGTFWLRHHHMFHMCRAVDGRMLVLNLIFLAFVSLLPFPSELLGEVQLTSTVIAFCTVAGAATLCEFGLWRHLGRHRELLLLPDIPGERVAALKTWRFWSLGVFVISILVSLFSPRLAVLMVLALPLYELVYHRRYHRHGRTLYLLRDQ